MKKQKNLKAFIISTDGILSKRKIIEHVKRRVERENINQKDAEEIFSSVENELK